MQITKISKEEYKKTEEMALAARELLEDSRFAFVRDWMQSSIDYALNSVMNNTVREVSEVVPITEKLTKIFKTPKKIQVDELVGQYKLAKKFFDDMTQYKQNKIDMDEAIAHKQVVVE
jgi:hypothetical protein